MESIMNVKERYLANLKNKQVHDLLNEKPDCFIDSFIASGFDKPFDSLESAKLSEYSRCEHCLGEDN